MEDKRSVFIANGIQGGGKRWKDSRSGRGPGRVLWRDNDIRDEF